MRITAYLSYRRIRRYSVGRLKRLEARDFSHVRFTADGKVKVYIETPDEFGGFRNATCWLPDYRWEDIEGYSETEMAYFKQLIRNNAHLIIEFSQEGGILNAAG